MSKYEMVTYLKDYADLNYLIMNNPNVSIKTLFVNNYKENVRPFSLRSLLARYL